MYFYVSRHKRKKSIHQGATSKQPYFGFLVVNHLCKSFSASLLNKSGQKWHIFLSTHSGSVELRRTEESDKGAHHSRAFQEQRWPLARPAVPSECPTTPASSRQHVRGQPHTLSPPSTRHSLLYMELHAAAAQSIYLRSFRHEWHNESLPCHLLELVTECACFYSYCPLLFHRPAPNGNFVYSTVTYPAVNQVSQAMKSMSSQQLY